MGCPSPALASCLREAPFHRAGVQFRGRFCGTEYILEAAAIARRGSNTLKTGLPATLSHSELVPSIQPASTLLHSSHACCSIACHTPKPYPAVLLGDGEYDEGLLLLPELGLLLLPEFGLLLLPELGLLLLPELGLGLLLLAGAALLLDWLPWYP